MNKKDIQKQEIVEKIICKHLSPQKRCRINYEEIKKEINKKFEESGIQPVDRVDLLET